MVENISSSLLLSDEKKGMRITLIESSDAELQEHEQEMG
jgi:hypothetical protein